MKLNLIIGIFVVAGGLAHLLSALNIWSIDSLGVTFATIIKVLAGVLTLLILPKLIKG